MPINCSAFSQKLRAQEIYERTKNSIFTIHALNERNEKIGIGSAVAIKENLLATNCHVAFAGSHLIIIINNKFVIGKILYHKGDICILEVTGAKFNAVKIRPSQEVKIGEEVFAIGNPRGLEKSISKGIISNIVITENTNNSQLFLLQTDAATTHGSSGGGLFDTNANLIGITTSGLKGEDINFALPTEVITQLLGSENVLNKTRQNNSNTNAETEVQYFGKSRIGLYQTGFGCFIKLTGESDDYVSQNYIIWDPKNPQKFALFPVNINPEEAIKITLSEQMEKLLRPTQNYLVLDRMYKLEGIKESNGNYSMLVGKVSSSQINRLMNGKYLIVQFEDQSSDFGFRTVYYGLLGFSEALAAYKSYCH